MIGKNENKKLGKGAYGEVIQRNGNAVKKFMKLQHLIQEYTALKYLDDCKYVVKSKGVNYGNLELEMELYDCSFRRWIDMKNNHGGYNINEILVLFRDILLGLIELHDRNLSHGDLKPSNILVKLDPLSAVIADCGFVSISKYAKVDRTAEVYRDPNIEYDQKHDIYSFGIIFLEIVGGIKLNKQTNYQELKYLIKENIKDEKYMKLVYNLVHENRDKRPSARELIYRLFSLKPEIWKGHINIISPIILHRLDKKNNYVIRKFMKMIGDEYGIGRSKKGFNALTRFIENEMINKRYYILYACLTLFILSSVFHKDKDFDISTILIYGNKNINVKIPYLKKIYGKRLDEDNLYELFQCHYNIDDVYHGFNCLINNKNYISVLLFPSQ